MTIKIISSEKTKFINLKKVGKAVFKALNQREKLWAELVFCTEEEIRILNRENRNKDAVTDVLSFPSLDGVKGKIISKYDFPLEYDKKRGVFIGSIAICTKRAYEQAIEYGHSDEREFTFLTIHSLLHLLGYDHIEEQDRVEMRKLEDCILDKLKIGVNR